MEAAAAPNATSSNAGTAARGSIRRSEPDVLVLRAVVGEQPAALVLHGLDVYGPPPEAVQVLEGVARLVEVERDALELVHQVQLAAVAVVRVLHVDDGLAEVGQREQEALLHLAPIAVH